MRVQSQRRLKGVRLTRDAWKGSTFTEADGTELEVVWNGHRDGPTLCGAIERNADVYDTPPKLHLALPRYAQ